MNWKEFAFVAVATAVAVLIVEPAFEMILKSVSPSIAAKAGIT